ncbi:patatin-like phospholipase family protein [Suttonella sp. R2A3]|uniref:patatin-like phospholipase family protein n=1 Tax=Suttonella sp. R2A3 TaxID=2908648 RepID=UPI001F2F0F35|nr:patatin-like phospholipase family protein [Suttonella sp. R2A3]UJF24472.1 patatin-like phospholipase family protein [Suttonella sp. R2A3]
MANKALYLSGGGARGAYQVGVLKAIDEILGSERSPFELICGTSAGAFNAAALAMDADSMALATEHLEFVWANFTPEQVFHTHFGQLLQTNLRFLGALIFGAHENIAPKALLNNRPLKLLMARHIDFSKIKKNLDAGHIKAFSITATDYASGKSTSFFQSQQPIDNWQRAKRCGIAQTITLNHLMASAAIPFVFPAVRLNESYFGDGAIRQFAPLSTPLHLGADRILTIGLRHPTARGRTLNEYPQPGLLTEFLLDTLFIDALDSDIERAEHINQLLDLRPDLPLRRIETLRIQPSCDFTALAQDYLKDAPLVLRYLIRLTGGKQSHGLLSYLLFYQPFTRKLIELGYQDTMAQHEEIEVFFR